MVIRSVAVAFALAVAGAGALQAQSLRNIGGPREQPPAGFSGQQFVDSRGCVFLRAGSGAAVTWVPRVNAQRQVICGMPPTAPAMAQAPARVEPPVRAAPQPAAPAVVRALPPQPAAPIRRVAVAQPAPLSPAAPAIRQATRVPATAPTLRPGICPAAAPVPMQVTLVDGGRTLICTQRGRGLGGAVLPPLGGQGKPGVPEGYARTWQDDRLNPLRGAGTPAGQAMQDRVWTRDIPARAVAGLKPGERLVVRDRQGGTHVVSSPAAIGNAPRRVLVTRPVAAQPAPAVTASTKAATRAPAAVPAGGLYVQVGAFGVAANAAGADARLSGMGLPVRTSAVTQRGKSLRLVMVGPFASRAEALAALAAARRAGFGDAFIRR